MCFFFLSFFFFNKYYLKLFIFVRKHKIEEGLGTPIRNHIIFPDVEKKRSRPLDLQLSMGKVIAKQKGIVFGDASKEKSDKKIIKKTENGSLVILESRFMKKSEKSFSQLVVDPSKKIKAPDASKCLKDIVKLFVPRVDKSSMQEESEGSLTQNLTNSAPSMGLPVIKQKLKEMSSSKHGITLSSPIMKKTINMSPLPGSESKNK